ncbi:MAG: type II toxin-antitoxin system RelE/ParE family toxin [bacterium]|nr:type II toxin-antitoxin system RelE/ParE family toxin [bacterium]
MRIDWSLTAKKRLVEIFDYIAQDNVQAAARFTKQLKEQTKKLSRFPKIGRVVPEINIPNIREIIFGNYRIIYQIQKKSIYILTIRHGAQQLFPDNFL